ncbi:MAG: META domain-containing protein [Deltaproteobacteria bacterium]|nr:META domain-containing protein [Deltaproteobacteria bacterium]
MKKLSLVAVGCLLLGVMLMQGCCGKAEHAGVPEADALTGKTFVFYSLDGNAYLGKQTPVLVFSEDMGISGSFCNRFSGKAELDNGVLSAGPLAQTKMFCLDPYLDSLERMMPAMLEEGLAVSFDGERLLLKQGGHVLEYLLQK